MANSTTRGVQSLEAGPSVSVKQGAKRKEVNVYKIRHKTAKRVRDENILMTDEKTQTDWAYVKTQLGGGEEVEEEEEEEEGEPEECDREYMACPVCFRKYGPDCKALVGSCGHILCDLCAQQMREHLVRLNVRGFKCPTCRSVTPYDDLIKLVLPGNVTLRCDERKKAIRFLEEVRDGDLKAVRRNIDRWTSEISTRMSAIPCSVTSGVNMEKSVACVVENIQLKRQLTNFTAISSQLRGCVKALDKILFDIGVKRRKDKKRQRKNK